MTKRFGLVGLFALLALVVVACGKAAAPAAPAVPATASAPEEHSVSIPVPAGGAAVVPVAGAASAAPPAAETAKETPPATAAAPVPAPAPTVPPTPETAKDAAGQPASKAPAIPEKIARVGDMIITAQEFARDLAQRAKQISQERGQQVNPDDPSFRALALGEMIDARVLRWVATHAVTVTDEEVNREFERGRRLLGSADKFQDYLKRESTDEAGLKELLRDRIAIEAYKKKKLDEAAVTEEEIQKLYDEWSGAGRFDRKERTADIQHLGIHPEGTEPADAEKAKKSTQDARARIVAGEAFGKVAAELSDDKNVAQSGGLYPEVSASKLPPYIGDRIFKQTVGEVSEAFEGGNAWHLLNVVSVNEPGKVTLEKAHDQIRNYLLEEKRQEAMTKAVDQAKYLMDIEIYKVELRPKTGPGSSENPPKQLQPPTLSPENYRQTAPAAEAKPGEKPAQ